MKKTEKEKCEFHYLDKGSIAEIIVLSILVFVFLIPPAAILIGMGASDPRGALIGCLICSPLAFFPVRMLISVFYKNEVIVKNGMVCFNSTAALKQKKEFEIPITEYSGLAFIDRVYAGKTKTSHQFEIFIIHKTDPSKNVQIDAGTRDKTKCVEKINELSVLLRLPVMDGFPSYVHIIRSGIADLSKNILQLSVEGKVRLLESSNNNPPHKKLKVEWTNEKLCVKENRIRMKIGGILAMLLSFIFIMTPFAVLLVFSIGLAVFIFGFKKKILIIEGGEMNLLTQWFFGDAMLSNSIELKEITFVSIDKTFAGGGGVSCHGVLIEHLDKKIIFGDRARQEEQEWLEVKIVEMILKK